MYDIFCLLCFSTAFEELEKALSTAQKTEEARKKLQAEMDDRIKAVEKASEEERVSLQQELTRVKQEVVNIMKVNVGQEQFNMMLQYIMLTQATLSFDVYVYVLEQCHDGEYSMLTVQLEVSLYIAYSASQVITQETVCLLCFKT